MRNASVVFLAVILAILNFQVYSKNATVVSILRANEILVENTEMQPYQLRQGKLHVYNLDKTLLLTYNSYFLDCITSCDTQDVSAEELEILSVYATYVNSFGVLADTATIHFGLLKSTQTTNIYGQYVVYGDGTKEFYIRPSAISGRNLDTAYLLLLNIAAHERAHHDNYVYDGGELGHGDNFQVHFNTIFWDALYTVNTYKSYYAHTQSVSVSLSPQASNMNNGDFFIVIVVCAIFASLAVLGLLYYCLSKNEPKNVRNTKGLKQPIMGEVSDFNKQNLNF